MSRSHHECWFLRLSLELSAPQTEGGGCKARSCLTSTFDPPPLPCCILGLRALEKLQTPTHVWGSLPAGLGSPQFGATKAKWSLLQGEDRAGDHVTSTRHTAKFSHYFQDLLKLDKIKTCLFVFISYSFTQARRRLRPLTQTRHPSPKCGSIFVETRTESTLVPRPSLTHTQVHSASC